MVLTRKRQAEDDAAQVNKIDDACSAVASLGKSALKGNLDNMDVKPTAQSPKLVPEDASVAIVTVVKTSEDDGDIPALPMNTKEATKSRKAAAKGTVLCSFVLRPHSHIDRQISSPEDQDGNR